jgi:hypothetical protein
MLLRRGRIDRGMSGGESMAVVRLGREELGLVSGEFANVVEAKWC